MDIGNTFLSRTRIAQEKRQELTNGIASNQKASAQQREQSSELRDRAEGEETVGRGRLAPARCTRGV
jgi:hypothetical protein